MKVLTSLFLKGLAAVLPLALTLYIAYWVITTVERTLVFLVPGDVYFPGLGWLIALALILGIGVLMQVFIFEKLYDWARGLVGRIPFLRSVFTTFQDLIEFVGRRTDTARSSVVMVELTAGITTIGFVTNRRADDELPGVDAPLLAVYLPMSYQIGGYTVFVPASRVTPIDLNAEDAMKLVLTAGLKPAA